MTKLTAGEESMELRPGEVALGRSQITVTIILYMVRAPNKRLKAKAGQ